MIDSSKAVFLPVDNRILTLFKGYILNGEPLLDVKESDVYTVTEYYCTVCFGFVDQNA